MTGQAVFAFVCLKPEFNYDPANEKDLQKELTLQVRKNIGPFAAPKKIVIVQDLPKTRSGKIMRRILRKLSAGEGDQLGDLSTLADVRVLSMHRVSGPSHLFLYSRLSSRPSKASCNAGNAIPEHFLRE